MKKHILWISSAAALAAAVALAGCGATNYVDGRQPPPSKLLNRVMIAVQNPNTLNQGALEIVDAYYDERSGYNGKPGAFSIAGFRGSLPISIQNLPEEQIGAVYSPGDGSLSLVDYQKEKVSGSASGLPGDSSSIYITRNQQWVFAANQSSQELTIVNQTNHAAISLGLPGIYRVSVNPGGSLALAFAQNSNFVYYPRQLTTAQSLAFSGGPGTWPSAAVDCEPQNAPTWCLFQAQSPDTVDKTGNYTGAPLIFDRPIKAVFSGDGSTAYVLSCGPECGGVTASVSLLPVAPLVFAVGQSSGLLPCNSAPCANTAASPLRSIPIPGGASNALVDSSTMYVVGQEPEVIGGQTYFGGNLTVVNLTSLTASAPVSISDGLPGGISRMVEGDDNTLWIAMQQCANGVRYATNAPGGYGCLTMYNTATQKVVLIEPYLGDATGVTAITGLHKIYTAEGGQVYIYSTVDGSAINNEFVTVTGTAWDVAYMDALSDSDNTVY